MKFYNVVSRLRRADSELGRLIGAVCFGDDTYSVPLQAADILANLTYKWFVDRMAGKATKDDLPPLLKRVQMSPEKRYGLEYRSELWDGEALRKHLPHFVKWSGSPCHRWRISHGSPSARKRSRWAFHLSRW